MLMRRVLEHADDHAVSDGVRRELTLSRADIEGAVTGRLMSVLPRVSNVNIEPGTPASERSTSASSWRTRNIAFGCIAKMVLASR